jgi:hypothetical protein
MTMIIRTLKRRPGGRESIRERKVEASEISLGRGPGNDVELQDLSISLEHARIKLTKTNDVFLELIGASSATVNGRLIAGRKVPLKPKSVIRMGMFELRLEAPEPSANLIITLEQVQAIKATVSREDEAHIFALSKHMIPKRVLAWVGALAVTAFFLVLPIWAFQQTDKNADTHLPLQADTSWNSGPLSLMHANLKNDCKTCHTKAFIPVKDKACQSCHTDLKDHARSKDMDKTRPTPSSFGAMLNTVSETFARPTDRCSSCHVEHNSRAKIIPLSQKMCADCHSKLDKALPETKLINVSDFGTDHPEFRPSVITTPDFSHPIATRLPLDKNPKGFSGLKFPHKLHLEKGKAVAKMAQKISDKFGDKYSYGNGVDCADCHRVEAGGALFEPISMTQDCAICHDLAFEDDGGYLRTLRHGEPNEVIATMRDFYLATALANIRDAEMNTRTRRRPGRAARLRDLNRRELAFKQADERTAEKVKAIFSKGGACFDCHEIDRPSESGSLDYRVKPISIDKRFYPKSLFDHESHDIGNLECKTCHDVEKSKTSDDVLLPSIKVCRDCHVGEESYKLGGKMAEGTLPSTCLTCHTFHDGPHASVMGVAQKKSKD